MRICWVNPLIETEPTSAGRIQTLSLVKGLTARGHEVYLIAHGTGANVEEGNLHIKLLRPNFFRNTFLRGIRSLRHVYKGSLALYYYLDATFSYPRIQAEVKKLITDQSFDLVHVDHLFLCQHLDFVKTNFRLPLVLTTHNVESSLAVQTLQELGVNHWLRERAFNRIRETEKKSVSLADHVVCVSQNDFDEIATWGFGKDKLSVIPLGIYFPADAPPPTETRKIIFVGSSFEPNRFALEHILREIAPKVPEASFEIIGSVCKGVSNQDVPDNVKLYGRVSQEELFRVYGEAAIALAPLSVGSGLKMKVLEYLSWGRPTVATPTAMQGLSEFQNQTDLLIEERIEHFPLRIKELLKSGEMRLKLYQNSRAKARRYSLENIVENYENLLRTVAERGKETVPRA